MKIGKRRLLTFYELERKMDSFFLLWCNYKKLIGSNQVDDEDERDDEVLISKIVSRFMAHFHKQFEVIYVRI